MEADRITFGEIVSIWWLIFWRTFVGAVIVSFVVGFIIGAVGAIIGHLEGISSQSVRPVVVTLGTGSGLVIGFIWSIVVLRMALRKQYRAFRIQIVRPDILANIKKPTFG